MLRLALILSSLLFCSAQRNGTFRAAVYGHVPIYEDTFQQTIATNLKVYEQKIKEAADQEVEIIVFPEYGLVGELSSYKNLTRDELIRSVPVLYDQLEIPWNPCNESKKFPNSLTLETLSCAALKNSIFVVASLITQRECSQMQWLNNCQSDHRFLHCTTVVFAPNGEIIGVSFKRHLVNEAPLDPNPEEKIVYIHLGFGTISLSSGLDLVFTKEMAELRESYPMNHVIVTNSLKEQLPFESSMQLFNGFAVGMGVNVLVANRYEPNVGCLGSGIFTEFGPLNYSYDLSKPGELIIADVPMNSRDAKVGNFSDDNYKIPKNLQTTVDTADNDGAGLVFTNLPSSTDTDQKLKIRYRSDLEDFYFIYLKKDENQGLFYDKDGEAYCQVSYAFSPDYDNSSVKYALVFKIGNHKVGSYNLSEEICAVLRCEVGSGDNVTCGGVPTDPTDTVPFDSLEVQAEFKASYVFPLTLAPDMQLMNHFYFIADRCYSLDPLVCHPKASVTLTTKETGILAFGLFGRY